MYLGYLMRVYQIEGKKEFDENLIHCFNTLLAFYVISTRPRSITEISRNTENYIQLFYLIRY